MSDRIDFTTELARLVIWFNVDKGGDPRAEGYRLAFAEVGVYRERTVRVNGIRTKVTDAVHISNSFHYKMLAADLDLFDPQGTYITSGDHPVWKIIAAQWESMHPKATSGRRWEDANHCSWGEGSKEGPLP